MENLHNCRLQKVLARAQHRNCQICSHVVGSDFQGTRTPSQAHVVGNGAKTPQSVSNRLPPFELRVFLAGGNELKFWMELWGTITVQVQVGRSSKVQGVLMKS
jgi:hypothetical protein